MTVAVNTLVSRAQIILQDAGGIRWPATELIGWLNDAQREIALLKPDATAVTSTMALVVGTKQSIPAGGNRLLRVIRNMTALEGTGGKAIRPVERESLDSAVPNWHMATVTGDAAHTTVVKNYCYDEQNPRIFYVYPGMSSVNAWVEIVYSADPTVVVAGENMSLPDIYANAVLDYMLFRAYSKDMDVAPQQARANTHYQLFMNSIAGKGKIDSYTTPNNVRKMGPEQSTGMSLTTGLPFGTPQG